MKSTIKKLLLIFMMMGLVVASCTTDEGISIEGDDQMKAAKGKISKKSLLQNEVPTSRIIWNRDAIADDFGLKNRLLNAVEPSECGPTDFREVLTYYDNLLFDSFLSVYDGNIDAYFMLLVTDYFIINQIAALDENYNADTFGVDGVYTNYVKNRVRSLEKFWDMPDMIQVRGQHSETLEDLDFIRSVYENYSDAPPEFIDYLIDIAEQYNEASDQIPENPYYSADGFATFSGFIVIGDGLVDMLAEVGLDPKVVWSSILAHEWAHQIQFANFGVFEYPIPPFNNTPESTRMTELEADFITSFYLTHKRGGTYNWKRVEDVFQSFFEIGDCGFESPGHHGTPDQRMEAARQGYLLADSIKKKGKISSAAEVHQAFLDSFDEIIGDE